MDPEVSNNKKLPIKVDDELLAVKQNMAYIISSKTCQRNLLRYSNSSSSNTNFNSKKILVVDSDPHSCEYLKTILRILKLNKRVEVDICHSGKQAMDKVQHSIKWLIQTSSKSDPVINDNFSNLG